MKAIVTALLLAATLTATAQDIATVDSTFESRSRPLVSTTISTCELRLWLLR